MCLSSPTAPPIVLCRAPKLKGKCISSKVLARGPSRNKGKLYS